MDRVYRLTYLLFAVSLICPLSSSLADGTPLETTFRFEKDLDTWKPRAESIGVARDETGSATPESKACLYVRGRIDGGWDYAISDSRPPRSAVRFVAARPTAAAWPRPHRKASPDKRLLWPPPQPL